MASPDVEGPAGRGPMVQRTPHSAGAERRSCHPRTAKVSGRRKNRTFNKRIKSPLLYQLSYAPEIFCFVFLVPVAGRAPEVSRTPNPRLRRPMLYPVALRAPCTKKVGDDAALPLTCQ